MKIKQVNYKIFIIYNKVSSMIWELNFRIVMKHWSTFTTNPRNITLIQINRDVSE